MLNLQRWNLCIKILQQFVDVSITAGDSHVSFCQTGFFYCGVIRNLWCFNCGCFVVLSATISDFGSSLSRLVDFGSNRCLVSVNFATLLFTHQFHFDFYSVFNFLDRIFFRNGFPNPFIVRSWSSFLFSPCKFFELCVRTCPAMFFCFVVWRFFFRFTFLHTAKLKKSNLLNDFFLSLTAFARVTSFLTRFSKSF